MARERQPANANKLVWYWNRLQCMSPAEMVHRAGSAVRMSAERAGWFTAHAVPAPDLSLAAGSRYGELPAGLDPAPYRAAAQGLLQGRMDVFALQGCELGLPPRWNRDPRSGREAPLEFGKTLDYRAAERVGDIKYLWEPNRHLQLVTLAQAWRLDGDPRYLYAIGTLLDSWFDQCPYLQGPNWTSSLELGIRLINWHFVWHLVSGADSPLFEGVAGEHRLRRWMRNIYRHVHFIDGHYSRYSSANNHLIGEAAGVYVAAHTWPCWPQMAGWGARARNTLQREALAQNAPDGVNREQAVSYQQFVLDFLGIAALVGRERGERFPAAYWQRLESMVGYLASIMDAGGNVPMLGDADDGYAVRLDPRADACPYRAWLATGAVLFERPEFARKAGELDDKTRWLLPRESVDYARLRARDGGTLPAQRAYPHGGYYILGSDFETPREVRVLVDAGPLGYRSIAAHGHADALALTLSLGGNEFLIDPGTYAYHTQPRWRAYFRGTSAHNTVRVDGQDQSVSGGNFMWLRKARASCGVWQPQGPVQRFLGSHDGYARLSDPLTHHREVLLHVAERRLVVVDTLECLGTHEVERHWHFSEDCEVRLERDGSVVAQRDGQRLRLRCRAQEAQVQLYKGSQDPLLGWVSRRFDVKAPTTTVRCRGTITGTTALVTEIECA